MCLCVALSRRVSDVCLGTKLRFCVLAGAGVCLLRDAPRCWACSPPPQRCRLHKRDSGLGPGRPLLAASGTPGPGRGSRKKWVLASAPPGTAVLPSASTCAGSLPAPSHRMFSATRVSPLITLTLGVGYYLLMACLPGTALCSLKAGDWVCLACRSISGAQHHAWLSQCLLTKFIGCRSLRRETVGCGKIWGSGDRQA